MRNITLTTPVNWEKERVALFGNVSIAKHGNDMQSNQ